jgi:hypothetical protein
MRATLQERALLANYCMTERGIGYLCPGHAQDVHVR